MFTGRDQASVRIQAAVVGLVASLALSGCKHDPNVQKRKYFESGKRYENEGKLREAAIQFSNAIKVDRKYAAAHYELAKTYVQLGSMIAAYQELQRAVALDPKNVQARLDLGNMLFAGGVPDRAKIQAQTVLQAQPNNADAYALLARVAQKQGDHAEALKDIQHALELDPNRAAFHTSLGLMQASTPNEQAAGQQELQKAVQLNPKDPSARLALAGLDAKSGNLQGAVQQAENAVQDAPQNLQARVFLAALYMRANQPQKAEQTLLQAASSMPDKDQPPALLLSFYAQTKQLGRAEGVFADLKKSHPNSVPIQVEYAQLLIMEGKFDQASDVLKGINKSSQSSPPVERLNADILLHQGKLNDALTLLEKAVSNAPDDVHLRLLLAQTSAALGKTGPAELNLRAANQLDPRNVEAAQGLAAMALSRGDLEQLGQLAEKMIAIHPDSPDGYVWRGMAELRQQQDDTAEKDFQTALKKDPNSLPATLDLGELRLKQKKTAEGSAMLQQVLARDPNEIQALNSLVALDLENKQPDKGVALIQAQIAKSPNNPALFTDLGALQLQLKDFGNAQASAQHALSLNKAYQPAMQVYSEAAVATGNTDAAIAAWQQWLNAHPDDPGTLMRLGSLEQTKGDVGKAIDFYKKSLALDSSQATAANNLAYLMVENGDNTDVALSYAETARRSMPNSPNTADTLAWVYYHKGTYSLARDLLVDAEKASPNDPSIHYHLGMTYSKLGDKTDASAELKKASELAPATQAGKQAADALSKLGE